MSLTSFVRTPEVLQKILAYYPVSKFDLEGSLRAPPLSKNYALVGTAFDYLFRFYMKQCYPDIKEDEWVSELAIKTNVFFPAFEEYKKRSNTPKDEELIESAGLLIRIERILKEARRECANFLKTGELTDNLLKSVIKLAKLDAVYRAKWLDKNMEIVDPLDISDLRQLYSIIPKADFEGNKRVLLNPTFPEGSQLVGGADCDVILDDTLLEIKTTKALELEKRVWVQLVGYAVLADIAHKSDKEFPQLKNVAIYFSRYGLLWKMNFENIYKDKTYKEFRKWFEDEAKRMFQRKISLR